MLYLYVNVNEVRKYLAAMRIYFSSDQQL